MKKYESFTLFGIIGVLIIFGIIYYLTKDLLSSFIAILPPLLFWLIFYVIFDSIDNITEKKLRRKNDRKSN